MDAKVNDPITDINGKTCAIIKVESGAERGFTFDTGTISITKVVQKPGQIWLYVSPGIRKLNIYHNDYKACYYELPLLITEGCVYSLNLKLYGGNTKRAFIDILTVTSGYLKIRTTPAQSLVYIGKTKNYELDMQMTSPDGGYSKLLDYGEYFYKIESDYCEPLEGRIVFDGSTPVLDMVLSPAYNKLFVESLPEPGASVIITGLDSRDAAKGRTPFTSADKFGKGRYKITLMHPDYSPFEQTVTLDGDGTTKEFNFRMTPQYAEVTCVCESPTAEIWIDDVKKGIGSWTGRVSGSVTHKLESRLSYHHSQNKAFTLENGEKHTISIAAPVPKYAMLDINSNPSFSKVTVNGEDFGESPIRNRVPLGTCLITVTSKGYDTWTKRLELTEENQTYFVTADLTPEKVPLRPQVRTDSQSQDYRQSQEKKQTTGYTSSKTPSSRTSRTVDIAKTRFQQDISFNTGFTGTLGKSSDGLGVSVVPLSIDYVAGVRMNRFFIGAGAGLCCDILRLNSKDSGISLKNSYVSADIKVVGRFYFLENTSVVNPYLSASVIYGLKSERDTRFRSEIYNAVGHAETGGLAWSATVGANFRLAKAFGLTLNFGVRQYNVDYNFTVKDMSTLNAKQKMSDSLIMMPIASLGLTF